MAAALGGSVGPVIKFEPHWLVAGSGELIVAERRNGLLDIQDATWKRRLHKSQLLFGRLGSTVPGLVQIRHGSAGEQIVVVRQRTIVCCLPDPGKDLAPRRVTLFFRFDKLLQTYAEPVHFRIRMFPGIYECFAIEWPD